MEKLSARVVLPLCLLALLFAGCRRDLRTARGVVEEFVDQHYIHFNLQRAKDFSAGLALEKINEEIRLTSGQAIDASTRKPRIHYRLLEKKEGESRATFLYEGTIRAEDAPEFKRRWLVLARKEGNRWMVSNFSEFD